MCEICSKFTASYQVCVSGNFEQMSHNSLILNNLNVFCDYVTPWTQEVNSPCKSRSENVQDVFWTCFEFSPVSKR